jgi:hypothetical protein
LSSSEHEPGSNGESGVTSRAVDTLILTYDRATDRLEVGGNCNSLDLMLDMLGRATRVLENKWRVERVQELRQQFADKARTQAILDSVKGRR